MASIIRDTGEIWSRLFDHRPFIQGEITFFLREFQEKRDDREVERLFKILEYSTDLKESQLDRTEQLGDCHLPSLKANVDVALSMCERVLQREQNFDSDIALLENREIRKLEWEKFVNDMSENCEKVNQTFQEKENEIKEFYIDLERKLHITP
ncbi:biogenesis of lysosome-related organelles complex 1 subunit 5-like isoform X2 [Bombus vosnesenskii]|uniref:Biogenesis of lysosome-related organelles complex 1 subunit 5 n=4 Tax=Bombus TaxID=28641 RepID=A0A6J3JS38_9HYME|nr:biogenesis of lysosome-related organelles complex 1 subunit 5 [Bombus terrestris]XP_012240045.1 biogenesis of lysosome-related organelles complex 1 subunit 5 isoform X2 [Bombus impatiens]XP_033202071.1 biogenesis of lysosome-related organelles complex 1 subunit 5-like isoform X2 [Bombus vancouverensis nearcticus]XP_033298216.1 biogenesis of lysosome-related organelles complex 1 subunit 5-like isoform X2 [Bombus bifarius]XP_033343176.1 biogenesis of lysosome-related organelles complex 1 subun